MTLQDVVGEATAALTAHRLRATLSSIGIVFGVATVVAAVAIAEGARRKATDEIGALGIDNVFVRAVVPASDAPVDAARPAPALTLADARALGDAVPALAAVAAVRATRIDVVAAGGARPTPLVGVTASWRRIGEPALTAGRFITDADVRERSRVAVVGADTARLLSPGAILGARIRVAGDWYRVVGVIGTDAAPARRPSPIQPLDVARTIFVPVSAMDLSLGRGDAIERVSEIALRAGDPGAVANVAAIARALMRRRHPEPGAWELVVPRELLAARLRAERTFDAVLLGIGSLALLIGGVGIMNIMLASVVERTQEIGVRRALGATRRDVVCQFAAEAAALCLAGGAAGVPVGAALAALVAWLAAWPVAVSPAAVALALALSTLVGLIFGVYPARLAASIEPIDALRA